MGRNALGQSYITCYGTNNAKNQHSRWYAKSLDSTLPNPPAGSVAGGPNSSLQDPVERLRPTTLLPRQHRGLVGERDNHQLEISLGLGRRFRSRHSHQMLTPHPPAVHIPPRGVHGFSNAWNSSPVQVISKVRSPWHASGQWKNSIFSMATVLVMARKSGRKRRGTAQERAAVAARYQESVERFQHTAYWNLRSTIAALCVAFGVLAVFAIYTGYLFH
ncbi:glycoside hydrolase family 9 protein [Actinoplanes couchii]|uniref:glycoside hydrolase family 9 protein n=2 Tax=Actinoplanes couchii TaxID=403638 RepID=UPI0035B51B71